MSTVAAPPDSAVLDAAIAELREGAARWAALDAGARSRLLLDVRDAMSATAREWADEAAKAKGLDPDDAYAAEEWMSGPYASISMADAYAASLDGLARRGTTLAGARFRSAPGGRVAVRVLPESLQQRVLFNGFRADVWIKPGVTAEQVRERAGLDAKASRLGSASRSPAPAGSDASPRSAGSATDATKGGGVGLVLGAGNISSIGPADVLYELVADNRASLLKLNPTFASLLPVYERALAPLIAFGVVRIVNGDGAVGAYLAEHGGIDKIHITGSGLTHDAIVWGVGEEAGRRRAADDPRLTKPITSELGGVSPVIVVPGEWTAKDLRFQAEHVVTMRLHNAGHNCIAAQALVLSADWPQKDAFLDEIRRVLDELPARKPWYPGGERKLAQAEASHPAAEAHNGRLLAAVSADGADELCDVEYFGPVLGWTELPGRGADYLRRAVDFANERLFGTLGANVLIAPRERRAMGPVFEAILADLRYGTIGVNAWTAVGFLFPHAPWGGFPGHTLADVGSGIGVVHNAHLLADTERTIVTGPFRAFPASIAGGEASLFPKPPWFLTHRSGLAVGRLLADYAAKPGWGRIVPTLLAAFRS